MLLRRVFAEIHGSGQGVQFLEVEGGFLSCFGHVKAPPKLFSATDHRASGPRRSRQFVAAGDRLEVI